MFNKYKLLHIPSGEYVRWINCNNNSLFAQTYRDMYKDVTFFCTDGIQVKIGLDYIEPPLTRNEFKIIKLEKGEEDNESL